MLLGQAIPEGLAAMPPGPELAAALAGIDPTRICNDDIGEVLLAHFRQLSHEQARMLATISEVVHRRPFAGPLEIRRGEHPVQYGPDEIRFALAWTRRAAECETELAVALVKDLPQVQAALWQGHIDRAKARIFAQHLADLPEGQRTALCAAVLPHAPRLTTGQIGERIKRLILELDPAYYERRYRKTIRDRLVLAYLSADGTAVISADGLPADEAAAAWERLDALARAARHDGHPGTIDQVRADLVLGLLDGSLHGLDRAGILQALMERFAGTPTSPPPAALSTLPHPAPRHPASPHPTPRHPASRHPGSPDQTAHHRVVRLGVPLHRVALATATLPLVQAVLTLASPARPITDQAAPDRTAPARAVPGPAARTQAAHPGPRRSTPAPRPPCRPHALPTAPAAEIQPVSAPRSASP